MKDTIQMIPIDRIRVANPRVRDMKKFAKVVESIRNLGLKKPIRVSPRPRSGPDKSCYDLICGQGRMEAFQALGHAEIPAIVTKVSREDAMLMSLVENMARRNASPLDLVEEIERLKLMGHSNVAIGRKLDLSGSTVGDLLALKNAGEGRLLHEAINGSIPLGVAIDIAKVEGAEQQKEYIEAYRLNHLNQAAIRTIRRVMIQREAFGKKLGRKGGGGRCSSAEGLVATLKKESQRQRLLVRKTTLCESRLVFLVQAMRRLCDDEDFMTLLRAEKIDSMPKELSDLMATNHTK